MTSSQLDYICKKTYFQTRPYSQVPGVGFPGGSAVKNPPAMQEAQVRSLGREDPLKEEMATLSSILAGKSHLQKRLGYIQSMGLQRIGHDLMTELSHTPGVRT